MEWKLWRCVITISVLQFLSVGSNDLLIGDNTVDSIINNIINTCFETGKIIVILNLATNNTNTKTRTSLNANHVSQDNVSLLQRTLQEIHNKTLWQILIYNEFYLHEETRENFILHYGYLFYIGFYEGETDVEDIFYDQIYNLKKSKSWNSRGKFMIYLSTRNTETQKTLSENLFKILWEEANIANVLIIISKVNPTEETNKTKRNTFSTYTWFPYERRAEEKMVTLNDCVFSKEITCDMFPSKVPQDFLGLSFKVGAMGPEPYVIARNNISEQEGSTELQVEGLTVHLLNIIARKINSTIIFNELYHVITTDNTISILENLLSGKIDIIAGFFPDVEPMYQFADPSIRYIYDTMRWLVPCPNPIPRVQRITNMFKLSLWVTISLIFAVTSLMIWYQARSPKSVKRESIAYRHLPESFQNLWAVLIGISVPQLPTTNVIRIVFITYVIFSLAITTIFQAFFTTFLIEPGYEKGFDSVESVIESKLPYGETTYGREIMKHVTYEIVDNFKDRKKHCPSYAYCAEKVLFERKWATLVAEYFPYYIARRRGISKESEVVCYLDEIVMTGALSFGFPKGSPLLEVFNKYLYWCIEGGFLEEYWSRVKHDVNLKAKIEDENETYFVFSLLHLSPVFVLLFIGCCFSVVVFVAEILTKYITKANLLSKTKT